MPPLSSGSCWLCKTGRKINRQQRRRAAHETVNPVKSVVEKLNLSEPEVTDLDIEEEDEELPPPFQVQYMDELFEDD